MNEQSSASGQEKENPAIPEPGEKPEAKKPSAEILREELREAMHAFDLSSGRLFFSGLSAGLEIGLGLYLMGVVKTLTSPEFPRALVELMVANAYAFGFILVILGRSELFTEQTSLAVLLALNRQTSLSSLARLWGIVFVSNLIGALGSAIMVVVVGPALGVIHRGVVAQMANHVVNHSALTIFLSAVMAGWLMGLLSWLVAAGRETISQIVVVWLITTVIGLGHLHHAIAGSVEVLAGVMVPGGPSLGGFGHFLLWTTFGNAVGGPVFLALLKNAQVRPEAQPAR